MNEESPKNDVKLTRRTAINPKNYGSYGNGNPPEKRLEGDNGNKPEKVDPRTKD